MRAVDITGQTFGRLTAVLRIGARNGNSIWRYLCICGKSVDALHNNVRRGNTTSCGCARVEVTRERSRTHGRTRTRVYRIWRHMLNRCQMPSHPKYPDYGGRGVTVCEPWQRFERFYADMGDPPEGTSIDRSDNNGPYAPWNCRWATAIEQANNKRTTVYVEHEGRKMPRAVWKRARNAATTSSEAA